MYLKYITHKFIISNISNITLTTYTLGLAYANKIIISYSTLMWELKLSYITNILKNNCPLAFSTFTKFTSKMALTADSQSDTGHDHTTL